MGDTPGFHDFVQRAKDMNRLVNSSGLRGARGQSGEGATPAQVVISVSLGSSPSRALC